MRCMHEASLYDENSFVTLTYDGNHVPEDYSLRKRDVQLFLKRLRKKKHEGIRYFGAGEYGETSGRPHYHLCLFNVGFPDRVLYAKRGEASLYISEELSRIWDQGFVTVGDVTFESAAYCARYVTKKIKGRQLEEMDDRGLYPYERFDSSTGDVWSVAPEFCVMSRGNKKLGTGGIGKGWFERFSEDTYKDDSVVFRGRPMQPPKYYDSLLEVREPGVLKELKEKRKAKAFSFGKELLPERLEIKEKVKNREFRQFLREPGEC